MPSPEFVAQVTHRTPLTSEQVRQQLQSVLPVGEVLIQDLNPPGDQAFQEDIELHRGEPHPVAGTLGWHPVIDCSDNQYAQLRHEFIPILMDWFEALAASFELTPLQMREHGFRCNKVARLMRVFTSVRMHRDHGKDLGMAPAIGWCRILLQEDWGRCRKGESHTFVLIATEQGWFVLDPFTRRMRQLEQTDPRMVVQFVVL